jgi:hypothetical protein
MFTKVLAQSTGTDYIQNIDFEYLINSSIGILFSLIIGFFILELVKIAITLSTEYEGKADTLKKLSQTLTANIKGVVIALGTVLFLNFILTLLGIQVIVNPGEYIDESMKKLEDCIRNYSQCGR